MSFWTGFAWVFLLWVLGWLGLPLARLIWGDSARLPGASFPDAGLAAGRMLMLILWTLLAFWCGHAGLPTRWGVFLIALPGAVCVWIAVRDWPELRATVRARWRGILAVELVFLLVFAFFFVQRGFWPDFNNGEKPMDLALMGACGRADFLPPPNPYAAATRLNSYYYLGHLQTALLTDAIHASPRWTYNLMCATLPALCFSILASLCGAVTGRIRNGVIGAFLVLSCGTLEPLRQWFKPLANGPKAWPFGERAIDYFATSRVIPMTINEYPWFTFSYGDVHAHYFDMPVVLTVIALGWALYWRAQEGWQSSGWKIIAVLCGLALGANIMTNTWDFPTYTLYTCGCLAALALFPGWNARPKAPGVAEANGARQRNPAPQNAASGIQRGAKGKPQMQSRATAKHTGRAGSQPLAQSSLPKRASALWRRVALALATMCGVAFVALLASSPFLTHLHTAADKPQLLWQPASPPRSWLLMWGLPMGAWVMHLALITYRRAAAGTANFRVIGAGIVVPELLWLALKMMPAHSYFRGDHQLFSTGPAEDPFVLIFLVTLLCWTAYEAIWNEDAVQVWLCRLALCGILALCWSETTYAGFLSGGDYRRQDTVFKFGLQAWFSIGTAAVCSALKLVSPRPVLATGATDGERLTPDSEDTNLAATPPRRAAWWQWPWPVRLAYGLLLPVAFTAAAATTWTRLHHTSAASSTVKGMENVDLNIPLHFQGWDAWANLTEPEQDAAQWLQDHARDGDNLIEAEMHDGGDYTQYTRYAQATGIPGVVGPAAHTFQWGTDWSDVYARKAAVHAFYTAHQDAVLQQYKVRYIVCGELERVEYGDANVAHLEKLLAPKKVYQSGLSADPQHVTTIYQNP